MEYALRNARCSSTKSQTMLGRVECPRDSTMTTFGIWSKMSRDGDYNTDNGHVRVETLKPLRLSSLPTFPLVGRCIPYDAPPNYTTGAENLGSIREEVLKQIQIFGNCRFCGDPQCDVIPKSEKTLGMH